MEMVQCTITKESEEINEIIEKAIHEKESARIIAALPGEMARQHESKADAIDQMDGTKRSFSLAVLTHADVISCPSDAVRYFVIAPISYEHVVRMVAQKEH